MTNAQSALKQVASGLISLFQTITQHLTGKDQVSQEQRSVKGRVLYKRALDPHDTGVSFWYDKHGGLLRTRLRVVSSQEVNPKTGEPIVRWAEIKEDGTHKCSCPDHKDRGAFCKHLRALTGLTVTKTGQTK